MHVCMYVCMQVCMYECLYIGIHVYIATGRARPAIGHGDKREQGDGLQKGSIRCIDLYVYIYIFMYV